MKEVKHSHEPDFRTRTVLGALAISLVATALFAQTANGPLQVSKSGGRYFVDQQGQAVYLAGAHDGWELQDFAWGDGAREGPFDWDGFLEFLAKEHHNVIRLWVVEHTKIVDADQDATSPMPYLRVAGQGRANDGQDRFDLDQFNQAYFDRLRTRVIQARDRGIYVIVMLFQGWSIEDKGGRVNPWPYHPFHKANNINDVDGDVDGDAQGRDVHTWLGEEHFITRRQRAYVRQVIDTVNDLGNVLYEIANESHGGSTRWQYEMIRFVRDYERTKGWQHPVGMTFQYPGGSNAALWKSPADWISPGRQATGGYNFLENPPPGDGRKIVLSDTDHQDGNNCRDHTWVWKTFCRGHNLLFMDRWTEAPDDPQRILVRQALGHTQAYARKIDLAAMMPSETIASSKYCLVRPGVEYLIYLPTPQLVDVDLTGVSGQFQVEWFDPRAAAATAADPVNGGAHRTLQAPFDGDAVLYLKHHPE